MIPKQKAVSLLRDHCDFSVLGILSFCVRFLVVLFWANEFCQPS